MKTAAALLRYQPPRSLREAAPAPPGEREVQALWFEQWLQPRLAADDGRTVEIIQPGFWSHGAGPDFIRAAVRFSPRRGRRAGRRCYRWQHRGARAPGRLERPRPSRRPRLQRDDPPRGVGPRVGAHLLPRDGSRSAACPQVELKSQLLAPWEELQPLCASLLQLPLPGAEPGRCSPELARLPAETITAILRAAGLFRLRQKAQRWQWRARLFGREQALYEALAEALGFHANQVPMRLVAQRAPVATAAGLRHAGAAGTSLRPGRLPARRERRAPGRRAARVAAGTVGNLVEGARPPRLRAATAQPVEARRPAAAQPAGSAAWLRWRTQSRSCRSSSPRSTRATTAASRACCSTCAIRSGRPTPRWPARRSPRPAGSSARSACGTS
ncbi:MAG: DUF2851 family protein [Verrucomicrobiota bacterium]